MTPEQMKLEIARLMAENAALNQKRADVGLGMKVSEKGAISVYGLQRMPVTLYVEQWTRLLEFADDLKQFMHDNESKLKRKT